MKGRNFSFIIGFLGIVSILLGGCGVDRAGIEIYSQPLAKVYLNDTEAGMTPYKNNNLKSGEVKVKIVSNLGKSIEKKVRLERNLATVINYNFDEEGEKSGYVLSMEKSGKETGILVSSQPEKANISIDGELKGISPMKIGDLEEGEKNVSISSPGYKTMTIPIKMTEGYQLIIEVQLALDNKNIVKDTKVTPTPEQNIRQVQIKETGTGWLRVREEDNSAAKEIGRVNVGEKYEYFEENEEWFQIEINGKRGWISSKYAEKILE